MINQLFVFLNFLIGKKGLNRNIGLGKEVGYQWTDAVKVHWH